MKRMPAFLDNCTSTFARTTRCDGQAVFLYRAPLWKRSIWAVCRHGWIAIVLALVIGVAVSALQENAQAAQQPQIAALACAPGEMVVWLSSTVMQCHVELGSPIAPRP